MLVSRSTGSTRSCVPTIWTTVSQLSGQRRRRRRHPHRTIHDRSLDRRPCRETRMLAPMLEQRLPAHQTPRDAGRLFQGRHVARAHADPPRRHVREPNHLGRTGAKVAVTFNLPKETLLAADRRAAQLGYRKRSHYATFIVERDILAAGPHTRTPRPVTPVRRKAGRSDANQCPAIVLLNSSNSAARATVLGGGKRGPCGPASHPRTGLRRFGRREGNCR